MAPEFPAGSIVIIDPSVPAASGRFAVAETATGVCLGRLLRTGDGWQLQRLTGTATPVHVEAGAIRGIVTQRAGRRRRDHKHYP